MCEGDFCACAALLLRSLCRAMASKCGTIGVVCKELSGISNIVPKTASIIFEREGKEQRVLEVTRTRNRFEFYSLRAPGEAALVVACEDSIARMFGDERLARCFLGVIRRVPPDAWK